ncbi:MAG: DUF1559 domain-containing protein, partial [Pirellulaceae bacterium]|nr:DUF1559 domain-containing protein [Pirellulaceae bacterium]
MTSLSRGKHVWRWLLVVLVFLGLGHGLLVGLSGLRRNAKRQQRLNVLNQLGLALTTFDAIYDRLPPAARLDESGKPLSSWRFQMCPYLESFMRDVDYDKPWDDPVNREIADYFAWIFRFFTSDDSPMRYHTNLMVVTGPGTPFDGQKECRLADLDPDTILVVEVADSGVHWMEPGDLSIDNLPASLVKGIDGNGFCVLFADRSAWFLDSGVSLEDLKKFLTIDGAKQYDRE